MPNAKVFRTGNSQVVQLPKGFGFTPGTEEVAIRREGECLILEPLPRRSWPAEFWCAFEGMPDGFEQPPQARQGSEEIEP